jgi:hypothetical protein
MRRISTTAAVLAVILAAGPDDGGVSTHAQSPLSPGPPPETAPPLPHASSDTSGAWVGDILYVHAGEQPPASGNATSRGRAALYALSPGGASWETVWTGDPLRGAVLVGDGEHLYRVGGAEVTGARRARPDLERWDRGDRRWVGLTPMPSGRTDHAAVVVGRKLWVIGGWAPSTVAEGRAARRRPPPVPAEDWRGDVLVADLDADPVAWTVVETASLRLHSLAAAVHGDAIWVTGGMTPRGPGLEVHRLDLQTRTLAPAPTPPVSGRGRGAGLGIASAGGNLFASDANQLFRLDEDAGAWHVLAYDIRPDRAYHALVGGPGELHIVGGASHGRIHAVVDRVETASLRPSDVADAPRRAVGAAGDRPPLAGARRWPGFRGPAFGHSPARDLPLTWSDEEGVAWRHAVGGYKQHARLHRHCLAVEEEQAGALDDLVHLVHARVRVQRVLLTRLERVQPDQDPLGAEQRGLAHLVRAVHGMVLRTNGSRMFHALILPPAPEPRACQASGGSGQWVPQFQHAPNCPSLTSRQVGHVQPGCAVSAD